MLELSRQMSESVCEHPEAERMMLDLARQLGEVKGEKSYGYLSQAGEETGGCHRRSDGAPAGCERMLPEVVGPAVPRK